MTILKIGYLYSEEIGEVDVYLDENNQLLDVVSVNDANWRHEYFNPVFKSIGVNIQEVELEEEDPKLIEAIKKLYGQ